MTSIADRSFTRNPYISRIFLECNFEKVGGEGNVLVVETTLEKQAKDEHLDDVLMDLPEIQDAAKEKVGQFERIDIRFV
ncbi:MAG TPA: hypothetical protein VL625_06620 [Patescibacteria group bacterium]|jgi:hypothetical protein|nr:hypothetical protein [Patescibacteria group bacterium]